MYFSKLFRIIFATFLLIGLSGCGKSFGSEDGDWASEQEQPKPTPTPTTPGGGSTSAPPATSGDFILDRRTVTLAHGPAQTWLGCSANAVVKGGYDSSTACGNALIHPLFADYLNTYFMNCVDTAAKAAGMGAPDQVFLRHLGTYNDRDARNTTRLSLHAYARAIDLERFILRYADGTTKQIINNVSEYTGVTAKFYDSFRQCWSEAMPSGCGPGKTEYLGSVGHVKSALGGNSLHYDHIHLSLPLCAGGA